MTKAFDCLNHKILRNKLITYGIKNKALNWIMSYLKDRYQIVTLKHRDETNSTKSYKSNKSEPINTGVPQGSNLGPILFLLYVNDLPDVITEGEVWLFADDVGHTVSGKNIESTSRRAQVGIHEMETWCNSNQMILNQKKTNLLQFYNRKPSDSTPLLKLGNNYLHTTPSAKYLGLTISQNLNWTEHIDNIAKRLVVVCCLVRKLQNVVEKEVLLKIYHGCFHSILSYGIIFWGHCSEANRIFLLQKRIIRTINKEHFIAHCRPIFQQLNILTFASALVLESAVLLRRKPEYFISNQQMHGYNTRQKKDSHIPQVNSTLMKNSACHNTTKIYNKMT